MCLPYSVNHTGVLCSSTITNAATTTPSCSSSDGGRGRRCYSHQQKCYRTIYICHTAHTAVLRALTVAELIISRVVSLSIVNMKLFVYIVMSLK